MWRGALRRARLRGRPRRARRRGRGRGGSSSGSGSSGRRAAAPRGPPRPPEPLAFGSRARPGLFAAPVSAGSGEVESPGAPLAIAVKAPETARPGARLWIARRGGRRYAEEHRYGRCRRAAQGRNPRPAPAAVAAPVQACARAAGTRLPCRPWGERRRLTLSAPRARPPPRPPRRSAASRRAPRPPCCAAQRTAAACRLPTQAARP
jgi:hypothetical protein